MRSRMTRETRSFFRHRIGVAPLPKSRNRIGSVKRLPLLLMTVLLLAAATAPADEPKAPRFVVYAQFIEDTKVTLDDGSHWAMDKGDCFPVDMFKEHQTKVILKLGGSTFMTDTS